MRGKYSRCGQKVREKTCRPQITIGEEKRGGWKKGTKRARQRFKKIIPHQVHYFIPDPASSNKGNQRHKNISHGGKVEKKQDAA